MINLFKKGFKGSLSELRAKVFMTKVKSRSMVKPSSLPPTSDETAQHSYRVYHQVQAWLGNDLNPLAWGWYLQQDQLFPQMSTLPAAPDFLLSYIRCSCKADGCNSNRCSCKKNGLPCSLSCLNCNGVSCGNPQLAEESVSHANDSDDDDAEE